MAEIVRRRSWGGVLPLGRHVSISGSSFIQCASASIAPPHPGGAKCYPGAEVQGRTGSRTDTDLSWPATVPGDNNGCSKDLRSNSATGSLTPRQNQSPCRPHHNNRFIHPGAPREWELSTIITVPHWIMLLYERRPYF